MLGVALPFGLATPTFIIEPHFCRKRILIRVGKPHGTTTIKLFQSNDKLKSLVSQAFLQKDKG